jgi:uncharacterized membrane protein YozB (DUF420 family)
MLSLSDLPFINACLNALSCIFLLGGRLAIAVHAEQWHRRIMVAAFTTSVVFLTCYLYYHFNTEIFTTYQGEGLKRYLYYAMLASHIILAIAITPGILYLLFLAFKKRFARHRQLAAYIWPLWLYVSVTGVTIYYVLYC